MSKWCTCWPRNLKILALALAFVFAIPAASQSPYRALIAYTPSVRDSLGDVMAEISLFIEEANQAYINSGIDAKVILARVVELEYQENDALAEDHYAFAGQTDGEMDEVHPLRGKYSADVYMLISTSRLKSPRSSWKGCGGLGTVRALTAASAVSSVGHSCLTGTYIPAHELGHNFGAMHGTIESSNPYYSYGHGYYSPSDSWRTVMVNGDCPGGCGKIPYFSNPGIFHSGTSESMGNISTADNTRLHNERISAMAALSGIPDTVTIVDTISEQEYGDIVALNQIRLAAGFRVDVGGLLSIRVSSSGSGLGKKGGGHDIGSKKKLLASLSNNPYQIRYRVFRNYVEVHYDATNESTLKVQVFGVSGRIVGEMNVVPGIGDGNIRLPSAWFPGQTRIIQIVDQNDRVWSRKLVALPK